MNLDFLEIGTCNFNTLIQKASDDTVGISVEPIKYYLDSIPNKKNVIKVNCAISPDDSEKVVEIYYIPEKVVQEKKLPGWIKGCSRIGSRHPAYDDLINEGKINLQTDLAIDKIKQIPISKLFEEHDVRSIKILKIDTEGSDCYILLNLEKYLLNKSQYHKPEKIIFESNHLTPKHLVDEVIHRYDKLGYEVVSRDINDTILKRRIS